MRHLVVPFIGASMLGLLASLVVHVAALFGVRNPLGLSALVLFAGMFVTFGPAVLVAQRMTKHAVREDFWRAALHGCPSWMSKALIGLGGYAVLNFIAGIFQFFDSERILDERVMASHAMLFYAVSLALYVSYDRAGDEVPRCENGHQLPFGNKFCGECGAPRVADATAPTRSHE